VVVASYEVEEKPCAWGSCVPTIAQSEMEDQDCLEVLPCKVGLDSQQEGSGKTGAVDRSLCCQSGGLIVGGSCCARLACALNFGYVCAETFFISSFFLLWHVRLICVRDHRIPPMLKSLKVSYLMKKESDTSTIRLPNMQPQHHVSRHGT